MTKEGPRWDSLLAGGIAGFAVDVTLFPLDTLKTRAQSKEGLLRAGGFNGLFKGLGPAALGSFPGAALFFLSYDTAKPHVANILGTGHGAATHMGAGIIGEIMACLVRVPTENVKQNIQTSRFKTPIEAVKGIYSQQGGLKGFYTGYGITLMREIPFSVIQFPIWEKMKRSIAEYQNRETCTPFQSALCGSFSGAIAAALTTPLDVVKTRLMTSPDKYHGPIQAFTIIRHEEGYRAFLRGIEPRVMWISIGGFVFFGAYETTQRIIHFYDS